MLTVTFYSFSKRSNSTKRPTEEGTAKSVVLKEKTSVSSPVFIIQEVNANYSYCKWDNRYYFIHDIVVINSTMAEYHCEIDVLATYKEEIKATSAFTLYSTSGNSEICDKRLSTKTTASYDYEVGAFDLLGNGSGTNSVVIVNVTGKDTCASYAMTQEQARNLLSNFDNWYAEDDTMPHVPDFPEPVPDIVSALYEIFYGLEYFCDQVYHAIKQLLGTGKADESIRSAHLLPLPTSAIGGYTETVFLGQYETNVDATRISNRIFADGCDVSIPWQATDWRRNAPYHEIYLYVPYFGLMQISPSDVMGVDSLHVSVVLDITSGDSICVVSAGNNHVIAQYSTNLSASYAIGSSNITPAQSATSLIAAIGGVTGAVLTGGASAVISGTAGISSLVNMINGQPSTIGANMGGATLGLNANAVCFTIFHDTVVEPSSVNNAIGTPTNHVISLNTNGYVQTAGASVAGSMEEKERQKINSMLDSGIYIE